MATTVEFSSLESVWLTIFAAILLAIVHVMARHIHRTLFISEMVANSLFGGMAVAYVFLYLLPELDTFHEALGDAIHFFILLGFLMFYGAEHFFRNRYRRRNPSDTSETFTFLVRLLFLWIYNALFIYTMPERIQESTLFFLLNTVAIGLHIVHVDYHLAHRHEKMFDTFGRYALATAPVIAAAVDGLDGPSYALVSDVLTALLAGFVLLNVFSEELPDHDRSDFRWFLTGVLTYTLLIYSRHYYLA